MEEKENELLKNQEGHSVSQESDEVVFEKIIETFVKSYAQEKEENVHEINVFVKFHKKEKDSGLYVHLLKKGRLIDTKIFGEKEIGRQVMTKIERKFVDLSKKHNTPVSMCTYDLKLPVDSSKVIITPHVGGRHLKGVTIKELL